ncbi:MAG: hypothetical protein JRF27_00520 [Deltaproteobacteria bacterium]|nr:hypothetical protein [Deltaproteobacteria bacterium]MBW2192253.1 hypothetical protein [Deltaproteobacteria bacterium]
MSFKENLLQKFEIKNMAKKVLDSLGTPGSGRKIDKETMRRLLKMHTYQYRKIRDLDLYIAKEDTGPDRILVLDNELAIYKTTIEDVALRKAPKVKEAMSIRNIIKIMNDKDVVISRKEDSLQTIEKECIDRLDLSFGVSDIQEIETDGVISLEKDYVDGVVESLSLFSELLGYEPPMKDFRVSQHQISGALAIKESGESMYGPIVIYSIIHNTLKLIDEQIRSDDYEKLKRFQNIVSGKEKASIKGSKVFRYLREAVVKQYL